MPYFLFVFLSPAGSLIGAGSGAPDGPTFNPGGFWIAQGVALAVGAVALLALRGWRLPGGLFFVASWLAGTGLLAVEHLLLALVGLPWSPLWLAVPWLVVGGLALARTGWP